MDWITHAAVGAAVGEFVFGKRMGNHALVWGLLFGIAPDVMDGLAAMFLSTSGDLMLQHGATHSLVLLLLLSLTLPRGLVKLWQRSKVTNQQARWFVSLVWGTHLLVDCLSASGAQLLWPYPGLPAAFNLLGDGDRVFTALLVLPLLSLVFLRSKKEPRKRRRRWRWGVCLSAGYVVLAMLAKWTAAAGFAADLARRGTTYERRLEWPIPSNILLWQCMVDNGDEIRVAYRTIFEWHSTPVRWTVYPRNRKAFAKVAETREAIRVDSFSKGWWIARSNKSGCWLADLRGGEVWQWGERKGMVDIRIKRSWQLEPASPADPLRPIIATSKNPGAMTRNLMLRTLGQRDAWEAIPRLAGIPGALPELLQTEE